SIWQSKRIVTNTGRWWNSTITDNDSNVVKENTGTYSALQGQSCNEIAALSRSMHKSQGFGSTGSRGEQEEFFEHVDGVRASNSLFDNIDFSWNRLAGGKAVAEQIDKVLKGFALEQPEKSIDGLVKLYNLVQKTSESTYRKEKLEEINELILQAAGFYLEARTNRKEFARGDSIQVTVELTPRLSSEFEIESLKSTRLNWDLKKELALKKNVVTLEKLSAIIPNTVNWSTPYWLKNEFELGMYSLDSQNQVILPANAPEMSVLVNLKYKTHKISREIPVVFKETDPVKGEVVQPTYFVPDVSLGFDKEAVLSTKNEPVELAVTVSSQKENVNGNLTFEIPKGWSISTKIGYETNLSFNSKGDSKTVVVELLPSADAESGKVKAFFVDSKGNSYNKFVNRIEYSHLPNQISLKNTEVQLEKIDLSIKGKLVGYVMGAGDEGPEAIRRMGYQVDLLTNVGDLNSKKYDAVVMGIRALNTLTNANLWMEKLLNYVENGGNLIVQYNTNHSLETEKFSPFPLKLSRDRITDETAKVNFIDPNHPVLNFPNLLTENDFENWVQERGLYFPSQWGPEFQPILKFSDPNEKSTDGALVVAQFGKGFYVYTGISFFRQFPACVPGAYRLFANLISLGHE
ncbi:MAG: ThuA domain-containing protein, partial [Bacteroidetes bacterium]|nr:ThuA domain-containing protein [Bacteroidota bacterium]